jgi:hypothetical protein
VESGGAGAGSATWWAAPGQGHRRSEAVPSEAMPIRVGRTRVEVVSGSGGVEWRGGSKNCPRRSGGRVATVGRAGKI